MRSLTYCFLQLPNNIVHREPLQYSSTEKDGRGLPICLRRLVLHWIEHVSKIKITFLQKNKLTNECVMYEYCSLNLISKRLSPPPLWSVKSISHNDFNHSFNLNNMFRLSQNPNIHLIRYAILCICMHIWYIVCDTLTVLCIFVIHMWYGMWYGICYVTLRICDTVCDMVWYGVWYFNHYMYFCYTEDLLMAPIDKGADMLPSPNQLKRKFILKVSVCLVTLFSTVELW